MLRDKLRPLVPNRTASVPHIALARVYGYTVARLDAGGRR